MDRVSNLAAKRQFACEALWQLSENGETQAQGIQQGAVAFYYRLLAYEFNSKREKSINSVGEVIPKN